MTKPSVTLVTTFGDACGISEYAAYWKDAVEAQGLKVEVVTDLHPRGILDREKLPPVIVLNYQAALLSQWHAEHIFEAQSRGSKVFTIWHDSGVPNTDQCKTICEASDHFVLHEPYDDLGEHGTYLRQGVPDWEIPLYFDLAKQQACHEGIWWGEQPVVGSVGLTLGYRNFDLLCEASALAGWGTLLLASRATEAEIARWQAINPATVVMRAFMPREHVVSFLAGCTATANLVVTNNAGTSGAIRQCLAARKPVLAFRSRQFRDLLMNTVGDVIRWIDGGVYEVANALTMLPTTGLDGRVVAAAAHDSWRNAGKVFSARIRDLL